MSRPRTLTVVRDVASYLGGWGLITHQAVFVDPQDFNLWFLLMGGALVGVPGVSQLIAMRTGSGPSPSPPPGSPAPSPPPPSPSPNGSEAER